VASALNTRQAYPRLTPHRASQTPGQLPPGTCGSRGDESSLRGTWPMRATTLWATDILLTGLRGLPGPRGIGHPLKWGRSAVPVPGDRLASGASGNPRALCHSSVVSSRYTSYSEPDILGTKTVSRSCPPGALAIRQEILGPLVRNGPWVTPGYGSSRGPPVIGSF
jgi:hypothetical protein